MKIFLFVLAAAVLEATGDAVLRVALHSTSLDARIALCAAGALLLALYGTSLNLAPIDFGRVTGLYVAVVYVMFQVNSFLFFRQLPTVPSLVGGALIVAGGVLVTAWH